MALDDGQALPSGCRWEAQRVLATVDFAVVSTPGDIGELSPRFVVAGGGTGGHSLQIEFAVGRSPLREVPDCTPAVPVAVAVPTPVRPLSDADAEAAVGVLSGLFGAPGFDSSARATVFREALEPLSEPALERLIGSLGEAAETGDPEVDRAKHLIRRVLASGPGPVKEGSACLQALFRQHAPGELVGLVADRWKTQLDWLG